MKIRGVDSADMVRLVDLIQDAKLDPRYCGDPDEVTPSPTDLENRWQGRIAKVAYEGNTIYGLLIIVRRSETEAEIERFAVDFNQAQFADAITTLRVEAGKELLAEGITTLFSRIGSDRDIDFAEAAAKGTATQTGVDPVTGKPSGGYTVTIDIAQAVLTVSP